MNRILNVLGIEPEESQVVGSLWLIGFLSGATLTLFTSAATGLFFTEFDGSMIPYAYIVGGLMTVAVGAMFGVVGRSVSERMMYPIYLIVLTAFIVVFWVLLTTFDGKWLTASGFFAVDMLYSFNLVVVGGLTINLFTLQQSKRLGGIVGSGMVIGIFVFGLSVAPLVRLAGLVNLMLISSVFALIMTLLSYRIIFVFRDRFRKGESADSDTGGETKSGMKSVLHSSYAWLVIASFIASFSVFYFVDFIFLDALDKRFPNEEDLAAFYGKFVGVMSLLIFIGKAFIYSRFLGRFGLLPTMVALPVLVFLVGGAIVAADFSGAIVVLFWLIVCQKLVYDVIAKALDEPTLGVLIQAAPLTQQGKINTFIGTTVVPVTTVLAGGLLLLLTFLQTGAGVINLTLIPIILLWLIFSVKARNRYKAEILDAVSRRSLPKASLDLGPESIQQLINPKLESGSPGEVIYCLKLLEERNHESLSKRLIEQLERENIAVRFFALQRIESLGISTAADQVRRMVHEESNQALRGQAIITYCALKEADAFDEIKPLLDHQDETIWQGAMIGMLRHGGIDGSIIAGPRLNQLRYSGDSENRRLAASITGDIGIGQFFRPVAELLRDENLETRRAAIHAAGFLRNPKLLPRLVDCLEVPSLRTAAFHAITTLSEEIAPALIERYRTETSQGVRIWIIRLAERIGGTEMTQFLLARVQDEEPFYRYEAVDALNLCGFNAVKEERTLFEDAIRQEVSNGAWIRAKSESLDSDSSGELIAALQEELIVCRKNILKLLACLYPTKMILDTADRLNSDDKNDQSFAIEALTNEIRGALKTPVIGICTKLEEGFVNAAKILQLEDGRTGVVDDLALAKKSFGPHSDWRITVAMENLCHREGMNRAALLESYLTAPNWGIRQTAMRMFREDDLTHATAAGISFADFSDREKSPVECVSLLREVTLFAGVPSVDLLNIAEVVTEQKLPEGSSLMQKGDEGDSLFVLAYGSAKVHDGQTEFAILESGAVAGELAALDPEPRNASVTTVSDALVYWLNAETLYALLAEQHSIADGLIRVLCQRLRNALANAGPQKKTEREKEATNTQSSGEFHTTGQNFGGADAEDGGGLAPFEKVVMLKSVSLFRNFPEESLLQLAELLKAEECGPGQQIVSKGDRGTNLYIIFKGKTRVHDGDRDLAILGENQVFGELAALDPEPRTASISAVGRVSLFRLDRSTLRQAMIENMEVTRGVLRYLCRTLREVQS